MATSPFLVHVARLRKLVGSRTHEVVSAPIPGLEVTGSHVPEGSDVVVDVVLESVLGGVEASGTVEAQWVGECRRCREEATGRLVVPVRELYTTDGDGEDTYPLIDDTVDLEVLAHDAILLELPPAPLCRADCRGLCSMCGTDLNNEQCDCQAPRDPRFAALDVLKSEPI
ncbi:MAG: DUF177 domain-containing protein [Acidimicrobiales bacterium]